MAWRIRYGHARPESDGAAELAGPCAASVDLDRGLARTGVLAYMDGMATKPSGQPINLAAIDLNLLLAAVLRAERARLAEAIS